MHYGAAQHQDRHHADGYTHNNKIKNQPVNTSSNSCVAVTFLSLPVLRSVSIGLRGKTVYWNSDGDNLLLMFGFVWVFFQRSFYSQSKG